MGTELTQMLYSIYLLNMNLFMMVKQNYTAIENNQDIIMTRDLKGFKSTRISTMTASEYLVSIA